MTTTTDPTALLAEALHAVCEAEWDWRASADPSWQGTMHARDAHDRGAAAILAASPDLRRALASGRAWLEAEAVATHEGILGWSNKRAGVEFYHSWEDGRWGRRPGGYAEGEPERGGWGHLLADDIESALGHAEGRPVLVIVGERSASAATALTALADALRKERGA
jgi:nicotinamidase-related amidase